MKSTGIDITLSLLFSMVIVLTSLIFKYFNKSPSPIFLLDLMPDDCNKPNGYQR